MFEDDYFLSPDPSPASRSLEKIEAECAVQEASASALASIENPREHELVAALDEALGRSLGTADGYIPSIGAPLTRRLQAALAAYGVTPDYGKGCGLGRRRPAQRS